MENIKLKTRKEELSKIYRYNGSANIMFYRPNLLIHTKRVTWLTKEICNILEKLGLKFNKNLAIELAKIHDDTEIITGDIVATKKEEWTKKQKKEYEKKCNNAINLLNKYYSKTTKHNYKKLLELDIKRNSKEFFIVKYADRLDAYLECIHEIYGGNELFIRPFYNKKFGETTFINFTYKRVTNDLDNLCMIFNIEKEDLYKFQIFNLSQKIDINYLFSKSHKHSLISLKNTKINHIYDLWISLHFKYGNKIEIKELYKIKSKDIVYL